MALQDKMIIDQILKFLQIFFFYVILVWINIYNQMFVDKSIQLIWKINVRMIPFEGYVDTISLWNVGVIVLHFKKFWTYVITNTENVDIE